jgi:hypothetical protein
VLIFEDQTYVSATGTALVRRCCLLLLLFVSTMACAERETTPTMLTLELNLDNAALAKGKVVLMATLTNNGKDAVVFLPWNTPMEGKLRGDYLTVLEMPSGKRLDYQGLMIKRMAPKESDFITLGVGESLQQVTDITRGYNFCSHTEYALQFDGFIATITDERVTVKSNELIFEMPTQKECQ